MNPVGTGSSRPTMPTSDLKLKGLSIHDRQLLEAIYCDFQVDSRASTKSLNLAGPIMVLLKSIVKQRTGEDAYGWATRKLRAANMGVPSSPPQDTSSSKQSSSPAFQPPTGRYYFATSLNKYKVMGRNKVMECLGHANNNSVRINSHSVPSRVQAARIALFQSTHPSAPSWKGIFEDCDFNASSSSEHWIKRVSNKKPTNNKKQKEESISLLYIIIYYYYLLLNNNNKKKPTNNNNHNRTEPNRLAKANNPCFLLLY